MNVAEQISEVARLYGPKTSVVEPLRRGNYRSLSFYELENKINQFSHALSKSGVKKGDKALLFVRPCLEFSAMAFALFKSGAVPVFIDPGMGRGPFLKAIKETRPKVLIGTPKVIALSYLFKKSFSSLKLRFTYAGISLPGAPSLIRRSLKEAKDFESVQFDASELGAILFTSGGTGAPKGVEYTHDIFIKQTKALKKEFGLTHEDVDIPGFPLFALFTLSMGMKSVVPPMDPTRPAGACPLALERVIEDHNATFLAGSPAIWKNLGDHIKANGASYKSVKHLVMFGAPIPCSLHESLKSGLPNGETYTPYGATESLPVANASGSKVLSFKEEIEGGKGVFIGREFDGAYVKVIKRVSGPIKRLSDVQLCEEGEVGELIVRSGTTTKAYHQLENATINSKIYDGEEVWHRMGDTGYRDSDGNLWFCGRASHVVERNGATFYSAKVEAFYNQHPEVFRSALIQKNDRPAIAIERKDKMVIIERPQIFLQELKELASSDPDASQVEDFYLVEKLPVDVRHNIKIDRLRLPHLVGAKLGDRR